MKTKIIDSSLRDTDFAGGRPVLLLAKTGFIIRNLLLGRFAEEIIRKKPLLVAVPDPQESRLLDLTRDKPITLISFPEPSSAGSLTRLQKLARWQTYMYRFKQAEKATKSLEIQTRLFESRHSWIGELTIGALIAAGKLLKFFRLMGVVEDCYLKSIGNLQVVDEWTGILKKYQPSVMVSTLLTHSLMAQISCDLPPVLAAHRAGIPCGTLVQSWDNLSSKTSLLPPWLERYWTWSRMMTEELLGLNPRITKDRVRRIGSPQFDFHLHPELREARQIYMERLGLDPNRPFVLIGTGTAVWFPQEPLQILQICQSLCETSPNVQILIRLHPKDSATRWEPHRPQFETLGVIFQETAPSLHMDRGGFIPTKDFYRDQINSLRHAAVIINTASTLTVDAAILDRPVICLAYDAIFDPKFPEGRCLAYSESTHYSKLVETGGVWVARSLSECRDAIETYIKNPSLHQEGRCRIIETVMDQVDGEAGQRLADEVLDLARVFESQC